MSLRARLLAVLALAAVTLVAAASAVWHVIEASDAARVSAAQASVDAAAAALADAWARHPDDRDAREREAASVIAALVDGMGGTCGPDVPREVWGPPRRDGRGRPPPGFPGFPPHGPPEVAQAMGDVCRDAKPGRVDLPGHVLVFGTQRIDAGRIAWAMRRVLVSRDDASSRWRIDVVLLAASSAALVAILLGALLGLRRGVRTLQDGVAALEGDLRRPVPRPPIDELASIGDAVTSLAGRLADAGDRERALSRDLAHRERLAGLGRVVAGVAHEIRNPLAGLKLKLDLLATDPDLSRDAKSDVTTCLGEVARLDRVVSSLLVATRRDGAPRVPVGLRALVDERIRLLAALAEERRVVFEVSGDATVEASRDAVTRVVDNLLRNAVEASPEGAKIEVRVEDGPSVHLTVVDHGPGPALADAERLFEPFFTTKPEGTGLGLFLSRALVTEHGGELTFERTGSASAFRVTLPREGSAP